MDDFEWDEAKSEWNRVHRGFGFDVVPEFDWESAVIEQDERKDYGELRYRAFGRVGIRPYFVAFTRRGSKVRIISVRRMHRKEARQYGL
jgi:uncharacterized DUF497 family protein